MRIIHLLDIPWWSGLSSYAFDCMKAHSALGHDVLLACEEGSLAQQKAMELKLSVHPIGSRSAWSAVRNLFQLNALFARERPDWVVAHTGSTHWIAWIGSRIYGFKLLRTRAGAQRIRASAINRWIHSGTHAVLAASEKLRKENAERMPESLRSKFRLLEPPVSIVPDEPGKISRNRIGLVGRLDPVKGIADFIHAAKIVQSNFPDAEFHIAGSEENIQWKDLRREAEKAGVSALHYHGFLPHSEIRSFMSPCAAGVIASKGSEEVSRALLEWFACAKPVVATNVGCISEILSDGENGYLVPPSNPAEMARAIKELLIDPAKAEEMGQRNLEIARTRFSEKQFQAEWKKILDEA